MRTLLLPWRLLLVAKPRRPKTSPVNGLLVVDKPEGPTSHDVVQWARRVLGTSQVGHTGTLDPMASGVLVLGVGQGTKLMPYLGAEDKRYETTLRLGRGTTTLDADEHVVGVASLGDGQRLAGSLLRVRGGEELVHGLAWQTE